VLLVVAFSVIGLRDTSDYYFGGAQLKS